MPMNPVSSSTPSPAPAIDPSSAPGDANGASSDVQSLLPEPATQLLVSGDVGAELAAYSVVAGQQQQQAAEAERQAAEASQEQQENAEVEAMRRKAGDILAQG